MRSLSVELKLAAAILAAVLVLGLVGARLTGEVYERAIAATALDKLHQADDLFRAHERGEVERMMAVLETLSERPELARPFLARDREGLLAVARPLLETLRTRDRITNWYFHDLDGTVFLRVHRPEMFGDRPERLTLGKVIESGKPVAGSELGKSAFALRVVRPWLVDGKLVGYLELAERVETFLGAMKARTGDDYGLVVVKHFLDRASWQLSLDGRPDTWDDRPTSLVVNVTSFEDGLADFQGDLEAIPEGGLLLGEVQRGARTLVRGVFPLRDLEGRTVGGLFVLRDDTGDRGAIHAAHLRAALVLIGAGLATAAAVAWLVHLLVFRRLRRLRKEMEARAAAAALPDSRIVDLRSEDELGRLELLFDRLLFPLRPPGHHDEDHRP